jgi:undecaprenyl-diphosphatase
MDRTVTYPRFLGILHRHDARVLSYVIGRRHRRLDPAVRALTHFGSAPVVIGITLALLLSGRENWRSAGTEAAAGLLLSHLFVQFLKRSISRPRPALAVGITSLIQPPDRFSFPSGHAAAALALALAVLPLLGAAAVLALAVACAVGITRCYLGVHYPGDVIAGWALGVLGFAIATGI